MLVEVLNEGMDHFVRDERLSGPVGRGLVPVHCENAAQLFVSIRHGTHRLGQHSAEVCRGGFHVAPARAVRDLEAVLATLAKDGLLLLAEGAALLPLQLSDGVARLAFPLIAKTLVEHQRQDVVLVILAGGLATQDIRRTPEVSFELLESQLHWSGRPTDVGPMNAEPRDRRARRLSATKSASFSKSFHFTVRRVGSRSWARITARIVPTGWSRSQRRNPVSP